MKIWFMFDNHTFSRIHSNSTTRIDRARELFATDGCGTLFVKDAQDRSIIAPLMGHMMPGGGWGVTEEELKKFFDAVDEFENWEARG